MTALSKLRPVENLTQVDKIEISLQKYFRQENFAPGDPLPKEEELAAALGVSRTAIREALARFKTVGIIESRKNRGMVITSPDVFNNMQRVLDSRLLDDKTMQEIFELRLVLEMGIVDILYLRKTAEGIEKLEEIVKREESAKSKADRLKCDVEFHSQIYAMSGNQTILRFQKILYPVFEYVSNDLHIPSQDETADYVSHRVLLNTLKKGAPEEFKVKMKSHLIKYFEKISVLPS